MVNFLASPDLAEVTKIKAPLIIQSAETDEQINASWAAYETALKAVGVNYAQHRCPGTSVRLIDPSALHALAGEFCSLAN